MGKIFISYSHKDKDWKERLVTQLEVLEAEGQYTLWEDGRLETGNDWLPEIKKALNEAQIIVLPLTESGICFITYIYCYVLIDNERMLKVEYLIA